jgi:hypothetical protein
MNRKRIPINHLYKLSCRPRWLVIKYIKINYLHKC